jgi:hypothetical protein
VVLVGLLVASAGVMTVLAQRQGGGATEDQSPGPPIEAAGNTPYDGRVVFIRLRYDTGFGGFRMRMGPPWSHDYPRGEMHFMKIIEEITIPSFSTIPSPTCASPGSGRRPTSRSRAFARISGRAGS